MPRAFPPHTPASRVRSERRAHLLIGVEYQGHPDSQFWEVYGRNAKTVYIVAAWWGERGWQYTCNCRAAQVGRMCWHREMVRDRHYPSSEGTHATETNTARS